STSPVRISTSNWGMASAGRSWAAKSGSESRREAIKRRTVRTGFNSVDIVLMQGEAVHNRRFMAKQCPDRRVDRAGMAKLLTRTVMRARYKGMHQRYR